MQEKQNNVISFPEKRNEVSFGEYKRNLEERWEREGGPDTTESIFGKRLERAALGECVIPASEKINPQASVGEMLALAKKYQPEEFEVLNGYIRHMVTNRVKKECGENIKYYSAVNTPADYQKGVDAFFETEAGHLITFDLTTGNKQASPAANIVFKMTFEKDELKKSIDTFAKDVVEQIQTLAQYSEHRKGRVAQG